MWITINRQKYTKGILDFGRISYFKRGYLDGDEIIEENLSYNFHEEKLNLKSIYWIKSFTFQTDSEGNLLSKEKWRNIIYYDQCKEIGGYFICG